MTQETYDCIVVGAGIGGLSAAYALHQRGANVLVIEAREAPGGSMRSEQVEGYTLENGPNTVVARGSLLQEHFAHLGIAEQKLTADRRGARRYVVKNDEPMLLPSSPPTLITTPLLSPAAKLRLLIEPFVPRSTTPDESVAAFFARRLGSELMEQFIDPFVAGVYAGNPREVSVAATFPPLWEAEQSYGSIVVGMLAKAFKRKPKPSGDAPTSTPEGKKRPKSEMLSFREGLLSWPRAIVEALGPERVWLNAPATAVQRTDAGWQVRATTPQGERTVTASQVVLATPAHVTATLLADVDSSATEALQSMPSAPLCIVHLGYRQGDLLNPLDGFGVLVPTREQRNVLGILWPSSLFPERAPEGAVLTSSFVGGSRSPELTQHDDEELIELIYKEHQGLLGAVAEPVFARVARWERAIPQYTAGHTRRIAALEQCETRNPGLHLLGNYRDGVSVERCWHKGHDLGMRLPIGAATQRS